MRLASIYIWKRKKLIVILISIVFWNNVSFLIQGRSLSSPPKDKHLNCRQMWRGTRCRTGE